MGLSPVRPYELFPYVSKVFLSQVLGEGDFSYGLGVFDFSHEEVERAVVGIKLLFTTYLPLHASSCAYQRIHELKKKKKKKKKKRPTKR